MIVDTSALIAILKEEDDAAELAAAIEASPSTSISAATVLEASLVARPGRWPTLDALIADFSVVPFDADQLHAARAAHARYGRGSGSPARLNLGDCMAYALAQVTGEPLLFTGDDFTRTDVTPAIPQIGRER